MTTTPAVLVQGKQLENVQTTQYTSENCKTLIDKFDATNNTAGNVTLSVNIVASGGAADAANRLISVKSIAPNETYPCPEIVGQTLENGDFVSTLAGAAASLTLRASGRKVT